jgi:hypothetical protein
MAPLEGATCFATSLRSTVVRVIITVVMVIVAVVVQMVLVMLDVCLRARDRTDRECSSGKGGQNESKLSHELLLGLVSSATEFNRLVRSGSNR